MRSSTGIVSATNRRDFAVFDFDVCHAHLQADFPTLFLNFSRAVFPELAWAKAWIAEFIDKGLDDFAPLPLPEDGVAHSLAEAQSLDALRGPVGADLRAGRAPDLLGVGFEKHVEQPGAKLVGNPLFEIHGICHGLCTGGGVAEHAGGCVNQPHVLERIGRLEGIVVKLSAVEDARRPGGWA